MCNPAAIGVVGAIGIGMQAYGMAQQGKAADLAREQALANRLAAFFAARQALHEASYEASRLEMRADQMVSRIRVVNAGGNADLSGGTPARLQTDVRILSEVDKKVALLRGAQKAAAFIRQGDTFSAQAAIEQIKGNAMAAQSLSGMLGTAVAAGNDIRSWYLNNQTPTYAPYGVEHPLWPGTESDFGAGD